jgi:hypothetical protein
MDGPPSIFTSYEQFVQGTQEFALRTSPEFDDQLRDKICNKFCNKSCNCLPHPSAQFTPRTLLLVCSRCVHKTVHKPRLCPQQIINQPMFVPKLSLRWNGPPHRYVHQVCAQTIFAIILKTNCDAPQHHYSDCSSGEGFTNCSPNLLQSLQRTCADTTCHEGDSGEELTELSSQEQCALIPLVTTPKERE